MTPATHTVLGKVLKAAYTAGVAFLGMLSSNLQGASTFHQITDGQWTTIALFTLVGFGGTFGLAGWAGPTFSNGSASKGS